MHAVKLCFVFCVVCMFVLDPLVIEMDHLKGLSIDINFAQSVSNCVQILTKLSRLL